ncbi:hypothetical protein JZU71_04595 [bacterium]|nr:hypothetical protein [bacterium]
MTLVIIFNCILVNEKGQGERALPIKQVIKLLLYASALLLKCCNQVFDGLYSTLHCSGF